MTARPYSYCGFLIKLNVRYLSNTIENMRINMLLWYLITAISICFVSGAAIDEGDVEQEGLYSKSDLVDILTYRNFDKKVYLQNHALLIQFYNSYCGHCRAFAPKFKSLASDITRWKNVFKLAAIDCSIEENNEICRQFEIMAYPTLRFLHENYTKANSNVGERMQSADIAETLKVQIIHKLQTEKVQGRLPNAPSFSIASYSSYSNAVEDTLQLNYFYTFLVFENENSTVGSELALNLNDYKDIHVKRVYDTSELAEVAGIKQFPGLVAVGPRLEHTNLTPKVPTAQNLLLEANKLLRSKNYAFTLTDANVREGQPKVNLAEGDDSDKFISNTVYYKDLELALKTSLHTEITRQKALSGEALKALMDYLDVLINLFPHQGNMWVFLVDLRTTLATKTVWDGGDVYETVKSLEEKNAPVFSYGQEYIGCKGSQSHYRGYSCGLWTLFHALTVSAARKPGKEGPQVLKAMYGYVKHFFGCTECSKHFQAMAERNRIFDVKENDKAVLWLWISHNEVNLRLAGDVTEDPVHPKIQYPSISQCPTCRLSRGAWNLPAVYDYLHDVYRIENIVTTRGARSAAAAAPTPFSNLDIGMLSLLYILSFIILILVIKYLLTNRLYRKKLYKHGRGKV